MVLLAFGVNYQTAPLSVREKLAVSNNRAELLLQAIGRTNIVEEALVLSTCNRTELYVETSHTVVNHVVPWIADYFDLDEAFIENHSYTYYGNEAVQHLMRVACGLNSMVLGEVEILGQIKNAFYLAKVQKTVKKTLHRLFQSTFYVAKMVRTKTEIGVKPVSIASIVVKLAARIFTHLQERTVLLIGAGDVIRLMALHLKQAGVAQLMIANRSTATLKTLGSSIGAEIIPLEQLPYRLAEADIVIAGTSSPLPLVGKGMVEEALEKRKRKPILMIDLAVPRDIEPQVGMLPDIYLYCIDDLTGIAEENQKFRQNASAAAEQIIAHESHHFMNWCKAQDALGTLKQFRAKFEQVSEQLFEEARAQLRDGKPPEQVLKRYTAALFNQLLHPPTSRLRKAGFHGEASILQFTRELFELNHEIINTS